MFKLIKYEFIKKYRLITLILITAVAFNIFLIFRGAEGSLLFLIFSPIVLYILYLVDIIKMYGDDLNKKTGYMIFMTPNSGYKIITSKLLTAVLEGLGLLFIYFLFFIANSLYIISSLGGYIGLSHVINEINSFFSGNIGYQFNIVHLFLFLLTAMVVLIAFITTVYTAITIRKSLFSEVKYGGLLSFIIFVFINWTISWLSDRFFDFLSITTYNNNFEFLIDTGRFLPDTFYMFLLPIVAFALIQIMVLAAFSGYLLEKKINL
ncbi:MAG TPA: hypothetical protein GX396_06125 [Tissierellia bacterium]|nr:hypothetical protein [Tissierellia bacterium]